MRRTHFKPGHRRHFGLSEGAYTISTTGHRVGLSPCWHYPDDCPWPREDNTIDCFSHDCVNKPASERPCISAVDMVPITRTKYAKNKET